MKKYVQITIVAGLFGLLVLFRQFKGNDAQPVVIPPTNPIPSSSSVPTSAGNPPGRRMMMSQQAYKDGTFTGQAADAFYGNIQVQAVISNGKITDVIFLQYPNDNGTSVSINTQAMPYLKQEALAAQSAQVDTVSGASDSSQAFRQSLASALAQAK